MGALWNCLMCIDEDDDDSLYHDLSNNDSESEEYPFSNIDLSVSSNHNKYECILVFKQGSKDKEWDYSQYKSINYDYLRLLDAEDIDERRNNFPHHGADWSMSSDTNSMYDFNKNERKLIIKALKKLNINCKSVHSLNRDNEEYKFYFIGISEETAQKWAHSIGYNLEINANAALKYLTLQNEKLAKATNENAVERDLWKNVYIEYDINVPPTIYKEYIAQNNQFEASSFCIRDKICLVNDIVTQDVEIGGAGLFIPKLLEQSSDHCIADFFPLHALEHLKVILHEFSKCSIRLPLNEIRSYFGEYFALYFAFLQFLTFYLIPLAIIGIIFGCIQLFYSTILVSYIWVLSLIVIIWAVLCPIIWKKKEREYCKKWGTLRFDKHSERLRPNFIGTYGISSIDGTKEEHFDPSVRNKRRWIACSVVFSFFIALLGSIAAIILLRVYVHSTAQKYGSYIIAAANTLVIMFFNNVYGVVAEKLNKWENYKTETEYENNLILKLFIFRFVNSYASLYYIAFFRVYEDPNSPIFCLPEQCMNDLRIQLSFIFLSQLIVNNCMELLPLILRRFAVLKAAGDYFVEIEADCIQNQFVSNVYNRTFDDYCEILIIFGYSTLFVLAFPFAPFFAFCAFFVEARIDGYKLCKLSRRPFPRQCSSIGQWQLAFEVMAWTVLVTNAFIICFTTQILDFFSFDVLNGDVYFQEAITAFILCLSLILLVALMNICIGDKAHSINDHIARINHIETHIKEIGKNIEKYIDSIISSNEFEEHNWTKWNVDKLAMFLHKVLYQNDREFKLLKQCLENAQFDGADFAKCDEVYLEKKLNLSDCTDSYLVKKFLLNTKAQLIEHEKLAKHQNNLVDSASILMGEDDRISNEENDEQSDEIKDNDTEYTSLKSTNCKRKYFEFSHHNFYGMSLFFEHHLKQQSKWKLWRQIEKDRVDVIGKHEMNSFLYLTIAVYIKGKYPNAKVPNFHDLQLRNFIIYPLRKWLFDFHLSPPGLTKEQFYKFYALWIREYYELRIEEVNNRSGQKRQKVLKKYKTQSLHRLIAINEEKSAAENEIDGGMEKKDWQNNECNEWYLRVNELSQFIQTTNSSIRCRIWDKFDKQNRQRLDTSKYLPKLIYSFLALFVKSNSKKAVPPKYRMVNSLMKYFSNCIIEMMPINQQTYMTRYHFQENVHLYFEKLINAQSV